MKNLIYLILLFSNLIFAQVAIENEKFTIVVKKAKKNGKFEVSTSRYTISADKFSKKIQIKVNLQSLSGKKEIIDPNKFFFLVDKTKCRYRITDIKYPFAFASTAFDRLSKEASKNKAHTVRGGYSKNENYSDTFEDYSIEGYKDVENRLNFGTKKKPVIKTIYYKPNKIKKSKLDIYFIIPKNVYNGTLYYGKIKIKDVVIK